MSSTDELSPLAKRVDGYLRTWRVGPAELVLVAFSGGPDSTALLHLLHEVRPAGIACCHIDHRLRNDLERAEEDRIVVASAGLIDVPLYVRRLKDHQIADAAKAEGRSIEEVARKLRYSLLREVQAEIGAAWIALGHTRNDQVETVLMRLFQGAGIGGLKGIPESRPGILRPLIGTSLTELLDYLLRRKLSFVEDSSNASPAYLRNRVRMTIVPAIEKVFPGFLDGVAQTGRSLALADTALEFASEALIDWRKTKDGFEVHAERLVGLPEAIRMRSLFSRINQLGIGGRIPYGFFAPWRSYSLGRNGVILQGHGLRIEERNGVIQLVRDVVLPTKKSYLIRVHAPDLYHITRTLSMEVTYRRCAGAVANGVCISYRQLHDPVVVRSRRSGDSIQTESGTRKLKRVFADWGVKQRHRDLIPVIEDRFGVLAVAGSPFGYPNCVRREDRIRDDHPSQTMVFVFEESGDEV